MDIAARVDVIEVGVTRPDGSGGPDPRNPHPGGEVPYLVNGEDHVRERGAIVAYLTDLFPEAGMGRPVGHPQRGAFLSRLFYHQGVMEPVLVLDAAKIEHPALRATFGDLAAVSRCLEQVPYDHPYLLGQDCSAVDLLLSSPFQWLPDAVPRSPSVRAWIERCAGRPTLGAVMKRDGRRAAS